MSSPRITVQSITGVDIELRIAGPGSRSYAFVIDWHIRVLVAIGWFFIALFAYTGSLVPSDARGDNGAYFWVFLPPLLIYLLYHPILEIAMHGRTPGKRIAGVRLVTHNGDIPGIGALLMRNIFRILDSLPLMYLVGLAVVMFTQQHVRVGDLAAGTLLVMDHDSGASSFAAADSVRKGGLTAQAADLVHELLDRWTALEEESRTSMARSLIARIDRTVDAAELARLDADGMRARLAALVAAGTSFRP